MNWIFGKNQQQAPPPHQIVAITPLQQQRIKQIRSLQSCNSNVVEERRDYEYRVPFTCGKTPCALTVKLPPQFPSDKPIVHIAPAMDHPWVDEHMQVKGCTQLNLFQMHSDLGKIIQAVIKEFKKNPPRFRSNLSYLATPVAIGTLISTSDDVEAVATSGNMYASAEEMAQQGGGGGIGGRPPEIDGIMRQLKELNREKLGEICANPDLLLEYVHGMESVVTLQSLRRELVEQNESIAKENLANEPIIEDLKLDLKSTFEDYNESYHKLEENIRKQDELRQVFEPSNLMNNLRIGILQAEEESEVIAEDFLASNINLDEFLGTFLEKRKTCHLRKMKEERFKNMVIQ